MCLPQQQRSVWFNNIGSHSRWLSIRKVDNICTADKSWRHPWTFLGFFPSLSQALHTAASSMQLARNGPCTWAQRTPSSKPTMADLKTSSRISLKSKNESWWWTKWLSLKLEYAFIPTVFVPLQALQARVRQAEDLVRAQADWWYGGPSA